MKLKGGPAMSEIKQRMERCCECDKPTGNAGIHDGSLYLDSGDGPYCEDCHPDARIAELKSALAAALEEARRNEKELADLVRELGGVSCIGCADNDKCPGFNDCPYLEKRDMLRASLAASKAECGKAKRDLEIATEGARKIDEAHRDAEAALKEARGRVAALRTIICRAKCGQDGDTFGDGCNECEVFLTPCSGGKDGSGEQSSPVGIAGQRDPDHPCDVFLPGAPSGSCYGDGHYLCNECEEYKPIGSGEGE